MESVDQTTCRVDEKKIAAGENKQKDFTGPVIRLVKIIKQKLINCDLINEPWFRPAVFSFL